MLLGCAPARAPFLPPSLHACTHHTHSDDLLVKDASQMIPTLFHPTAGYQVGVLNTALHPIAKDLHYHKDGVLSSAVVLGAAAGAITAGKLADTLGPRHAQVQ